MFSSTQPPPRAPELNVCSLYLEFGTQPVPHHHSRSHSSVTVTQAGPRGVSSVTLSPLTHIPGPAHSLISRHNPCAPAPEPERSFRPPSVLTLSQQSLRATARLSSSHGCLIVTRPFIFMTKSKLSLQHASSHPGNSCPPQQRPGPLVKPCLPSLSLPTRPLSDFSASCRCSGPFSSITSFGKACLTPTSPTKQSCVSLLQAPAKPLGPHTVPTTLAWTAVVGFPSSSQPVCQFYLFV